MVFGVWQSIGKIRFYVGTENKAGPILCGTRNEAILILWILINRAYIQLNALTLRI